MPTTRIDLSPTTAISALAAIGLVYLLVHEFLTSNTLRSTPIQSVALVSAAPPPPPPQVQKPNEEEKIEKIEPTKAIDVNDWTPGEAGATPGPGTGSAGVPTNGMLGLDEAGGSGSDAFGLAGKPGGHELLLTGGGGGNPYARFLQYANEVQANIQAQLNRVAALTQDCYTARVGIWVASSGSIKDVKILKSTGDGGLDSKIRDALLQLAPMDASPPPPDMPWPIGLQVSAHRADCKVEDTSVDRPNSQ